VLQVVQVAVLLHVHVVVALQLLLQLLRLLHELRPHALQALQALLGALQLLLLFADLGFDVAFIGLQLFALLPVTVVSQQRLSKTSSELKRTYSSNDCIRLSTT
jgi:hypothetical protein